MAEAIHRLADNLAEARAGPPLPEHVADTGRTEDAGLARLANDIGITTDKLLACRRYVISGNVRAMDGW
ncbi:hypothetical protein ACFQ0T_37970 [Kitasatospora gansuensis]